MRSSDDRAGEAIRVLHSGLVCSLGADAATSCAAARAGLTRASPFEAYGVTGPEGDEEPLLVHAAPYGVEGFEGDARLLQLLIVALRDLDTAALEGPVGAYLAINDPLRWLGAEQAAAIGTAPPDAAARGAWLWSGLERALAPPTWPRLLQVEDRGHTAFHRALAHAARDLRAGTLRTALVLAADSLLDSAGLGLLEAAGRLKTPADPAGLQPGEAAGYVVLSREAATRSTPGTLSLRALGFSREPQIDPTQGAPTGQGIAQALHDAARHLHFSRLLPVWASSDHNGEPWRAMDWGQALVQLGAQQTLDLRGSTLFPASAVGDTGAASGLVALCMAQHAHARGCAPAPVAALVSCADGAERSALICQAH
jgi:3-oxoacyl-[acyl-carrier-protein] synthase I